MNQHVRKLRWGAVVSALTLAGVLTAQSVSALTWTRVEEVPASDVFSIHHDGTTLYAGTANIVYFGANEGTSWTPSSPVSATATAIATVVPAGGALWAGTFGQGVFRTTNNGTNWDPVNTGLTGLGAAQVNELVEKSGKLYVATSGAGVFVLDLATPTQWAEFNAGLPVFTAGTVTAIGLHGTTLVAPAGPNGFVYRFPQGATEWQEVSIVPPIAPGLLVIDLLVNGADLFVGTSNRAFRSVDDAQTWTAAGNGLVNGTDTVLAAEGSTLFAGVDFLGNNHRVYRSDNRADSWTQIDDIGSFLYALEVAGDKLFAARQNGLFWTPLATTGIHATTLTEFKGLYR